MIQKIAQLTGHNAAVFCLTPGRDEQSFLSAAGDGWIVAWQLDDPEMGRLVAKAEAQLFALHYFPDREWVVAGNMNGGIHWIDLHDPDKSKNIAHHQKGVFDLLQVDDTLFSLGGDGRISRWSIPERRSMDSLHLSNQSLRSIDFLPEKRELAVGASDNNIYLLDADTLEMRQTIKGAHQNSVFSLCYSPDGTALLSGGRDAMLKRWELEDPRVPSWAEPAHLYTINKIAFSPDGRYVATASRDKTLKLWDARDLKLLKVIEGVRDKGHFNSVNTLLWVNDHLVTGSDDRTMILWKLAG